jgi:ribosomal-protein-serine acetyltransferase
MHIPYHLDDEVELRLLDPRYTEPLFAIVDRDRDYLKRWQNWPAKVRTPADMKRLFQYAAQKRKQNRGIDLAIIYRGQPVGKAGLVYINWPEKMTEIGYWVAKDMQGKGLISRTVRVLTGYALGKLKLETVQIRCADGNLRSRAIPERLGFVFSDHKSATVRLHGQLIDEVAYTMTARRWYRRMIYHITSEVEWRVAKREGQYVAPSLQTEGFIHLSKLKQVTKVANGFYAGQKNLVLLCVDPKRLQVPLKFEPPAANIHADHEEEGEVFPHLYGPLDSQAVIRVFEFPANGDGNFPLPVNLPK